MRPDALQIKGICCAFLARGISLHLEGAAAYIKYRSSKYHEKLREVERCEQDLAERRHSLLKEYPNRAELLKLSALERRREIIARDSRFYGVSACIAGLLMAIAGVSGFVYCHAHPDGTTGSPLLLLGLAAFGLFLSAGTSGQVGKAIGELPPARKSHEPKRL
jgi:hypothetical protein